MPERAERPNFLIFVTDQHPWRLLGCAGHPVLRTPHIDRLAAEGVRFSRCYTVHPLCMPTRATWFTGQTPRGHGVRCNGIPLRRTVPTAVEALRRAGYATHSIGKVHLSPYWVHKSIPPETLSPEDWPENNRLWDRGAVTRLPSPYHGLASADWLGPGASSCRSHYSEWLLEREPDGMRLMRRETSTPFGAGIEVCWPMALPAELHYTNWMVDRATAFLEERASDGRPFFLWWSAPDPHPPYSAPRPWCDMYRPEDMPLPVRREGELDERPPHYRMFFERGGMSAGRILPTNVPDEHMRAVRAMVCAMVSQVDDAVGRTLSSLERLGLAENTVVVFMADHGQMLGDHWMFNMPPTHLDSLIRVPCIWRLPQERRGVTSEALVSHLDFAPTLLDLAGLEPLEGLAPPEPEAPDQLPALPGRSLRPLLTGEADRVQDSVVVENDEDYMGMRIRTLVTEDWHINCYVGAPYGELHDLRNDPHQLHNLWDDPAHRAVRRDLQAELMYRLAETDSRLPRRMGHA